MIRAEHSRVQTSPRGGENCTHQGATPRRRLRRLLVAAWIVAPIATTLVATAPDIGGKPVSDAERAPAPVTATLESPYRFTTLEQMVAASDLTVVGRVVTAERGRRLPDTNVVTRAIELEIDRVLAGRADKSYLIVEEPGWTTDGTPLVVAGLAPTTLGDAGIFFLRAGRTAHAPFHSVINTQGRYLFGGGDALVGSDPTDPLVRRLAGAGAAGLETRIAAVHEAAVSS